MIVRFDDVAYRGVRHALLHLKGASPDLWAEYSEWAAALERLGADDAETRIQALVDANLHAERCPACSIEGQSCPLFGDVRYIVRELKRILTGEGTPQRRPGGSVLKVPGRTGT